MESDQRSGGVMRMVIVSAVTAVIVVVLMAVAGVGVYYFVFRQSGTDQSAKDGESIADVLDQAKRSITGSSTDAAKIRSVAFRSWTHAGPLYPGPNDPPGYVSGSSVVFRSDLSASRERKKDYDRDLPDEINLESAAMSAEQFEKLAKICADNDIVSAADSSENRSEAGTTLTIDYDGTVKTIVTSNLGKDSATVANVLKAFKELESTVRWAAAR